MKSLVLLSALLLGTSLAYAGASEVFPSGPSNLLPAEIPANTLLWVGGNVAKGLFDGMTQASQQTDGSAEARLGENLGCYHDPSNKAAEYSCALTLETATGKAVPR